MKANELQIGDYVNYRGQIIKVTSLYDKGGSNEVGWSDRESVWVNGRCIEPIPLTPEILEKNGFSNRYDGEDDLGYAQSCGTIIGIHICGKNGLMDEMYFKYVHELQQALKLCGIEKEIEL